MIIADVFTQLAFVTHTHTGESMTSLEGTEYIYLQSSRADERRTRKRTLQTVTTIS